MTLPVWTTSFSLANMFSHRVSAALNPQRQWFVAVDRDGSGQINPTELSQALINGDWTPFDLDTVKMLMSVFDVDRSGHISFNEVSESLERSECARYSRCFPPHPSQFAGLWKYIQDWQGVFKVSRDLGCTVPTLSTLCLTHESFLSLVHVAL